LPALIFAFSLFALAKTPREDFYSRMLNGQSLESAAHYSGYAVQPRDKYFYYAFVQGEPQALAAVHSNIWARETRYDFLERLWAGEDWVLAARYSDYQPTRREKFFLLLRQGDGLQSAIDNSRHTPTPADRYYYEVYIVGRSPNDASEDTGFAPGRRRTLSFECATSFGLKRK
jgi:hypothetical protein